MTSRATRRLTDSPKMHIGDVYGFPVRDWYGDLPSGLTLYLVSTKPACSTALSNIALSVVTARPVSEVIWLV